MKLSKEKLMAEAASTGYRPRGLKRSYDYWSFWKDFAAIRSSGKDSYSKGEPLLTSFSLSCRASRWISVRRDGAGGGSDVAITSHAC